MAISTWLRVEEVPFSALEPGDLYTMDGPQWKAGGHGYVYLCLEKRTDQQGTCWRLIPKKKGG